MIDPVRTDMNCTNCSRNFIAQLDMGLDGNHVIECPYCAHEHCRVVEAGEVTGERWSSRVQRVDVDARCVWKADSQPIITSTAAAFIRSAWLNRVDVQL
jgi:DNA-directed RNA polymerase subunit RPC12/RpoP